ncbi:MAG TPA: DUF5675 family protein [Aquabacterium sp.]|nr:DUF5675 family protein [Aquabacterium sp.]
MKMELKRVDLTPMRTIGVLFVDGTRECWTLEDTVRPDGIKIHGETAIPVGVYQLDVTMSPRFGRDLPLLINVANFTGVRIHPGNTAGDTEGCILVGVDRAANSILRSREAFDALFAKIMAARARHEPITIEVS